MDDIISTQPQEEPQDLTPKPPSLSTPRYVVAATPPEVPKECKKPRFVGNVRTAPAPRLDYVYEFKHGTPGRFAMELAAIADKIHKDNSGYGITSTVTANRPHLVNYTIWSFPFPKEREEFFDFILFLRSKSYGPNKDPRYYSSYLSKYEEAIELMKKNFYDDPRVTDILEEHNRLKIRFPDKISGCMIIAIIGSFALTFFVIWQLIFGD